MNWYHIEGKWKQFTGNARLTRVVKWISIPALLLAALCSGLAGSYEALANLAICIGIMIFVCREVRFGEYYSAAGFVAVAVVFSPIFLVVKIFLLLGGASLASCFALVAAFRTRPVAILSKEASGLSLRNN